MPCGRTCRDAYGGIWLGHTPRPRRTIFINHFRQAKRPRMWPLLSGSRLYLPVPQIRNRNRQSRVKIRQRKPNHSIEEKVEDWCKRQLSSIRYYTKTEEINPEIGNALRKAPSKNGGDGRNYPDIQCFIDTPQIERIPVMIEVKGRKGDLIKSDDNGEILNTNTKGEPLYSNIAKYAVNGAIHYAKAILDYTESYDKIIAIGVNGYNLTDGTIKYEIGAYYMSKNNLFVPKKIAEYTDLSFLLPQNIEQLLDNIANLSLTEEEIEAKKLQLEDDIERKLKEINQRLHDEQDILVGSRVKLIAGLVMAGLGVKGKVSPLKVDDLRGELGSQINDGAIIMSRVSEYLQAKELPSEKRLIIENELRGVFNNSSLYRPINGESKLHTTYSDVKANIIPFLTGELHNLDFTGRMFNVLNAWVDVPDGDKNDVVLTPRYVTELMAKLCNVNMNSYVWDFATGSGGFLISAMHEMIADVKDKIKSPAEQEAKIAKIKMEQLLGIEKLSEIYMLAVLNMILMKDGSANIIKGNSLTDFMGTYEQGKHKGKEFPANVFLLNPPYSAEGKGFIFVEKALSLMHHGGMAAVLIQENAGSGNGTPYTKNILKNNTLVASIRMSDIFCGKASVQTAIYVFRVGEPHSTDSIVRFIDFSNDGYTRQNRKKSSQSVNLRDTGNAKERYAEVVKLVRHGKGLNDANLNFFVDGETYFEDQISLDGNDWTIQQHRKFNVIPSIEDFQKVVKDYLSWRVGEVLKNEGDVSLGKQ